MPENDAKALWMLAQTRALRRYLDEADATTGRAVRLAILQTIIVEGLTNKALSNPIVDEALAYAERQAQRGRMGAEARWGGVERETLGEAITALAARKDGLGESLPPNELWGELYARLDGAGLKPIEHGGPQLKAQSYKFGAETISYEAFSKQIRRLRE